MTTTPGEIVTRIIRGVPIQYRDGTTDELVLDADYIATRFLPEGFAPPEDGVVLDVGGHIGVFGVLATQYVPQGTVHILEPSSENFLLLARNVAASQGAENRLLAHQVALAAEDGQLRLHHAPGSVGHSLYALAEWEGEPFEPRPSEAGVAVPYEDVEVRTLASFLADISVSTVDFMKMNIEGAEYDVLLTSSDETLRAIRCMTVELHPENEGKAELVIERLQSLGFRTAFTPAGGNPYVKGWVTAQND